MLANGKILLGSYLSVLVAVVAGVMVPGARALGQGGGGACVAGWLPVTELTGTQSSVRNLVALPSGDIIVGGDFTVALSDGTSTRDIARYGPVSNSWTALGAFVATAFPGTGGSVYALAALPDGDVIVSGQFSVITSSGATATRIARYRSSTNSWTPLQTSTRPTTIFGNVYALGVLANGEIILGGEFSVRTNGGATATNIARFNPASNTWMAMGSGTNRTVNALAVLAGGDVIVGGDFTIAGGVPTSYLARYSPASNEWTAPGPGRLNDYVSAISVLSADEVIVGGMFTSVGGVPTSNVARYSLTSNSLIATGPGVIRTGNSSVSALEVLPSGEVLVGGSFPAGVSGGIATNCLIRYNPTTGQWSSFQNQSVYGRVSALSMLPNGELFVGAEYIRIGNSASIPLARYRSGRLCPADFNCSGAVGVQDIFSFLAVWFDGTPAADFNASGTTDVQDIFDFLAAWFAGCL